MRPSSHYVGKERHGFRCSGCYDFKRNNYPKLLFNNRTRICEPSRVKINYEKTVYNSVRERAYAHILELSWLTFNQSVQTINQIRCTSIGPMSLEFELRMQNFVRTVNTFAVILVGMTSGNLSAYVYGADWKAPSNKFLMRPVYVGLMLWRKWLSVGLLVFHVAHIRERIPTVDSDIFRIYSALLVRKSSTDGAICFVNIFY